MKGKKKYYLKYKKGSKVMTIKMKYVGELEKPIKQTAGSAGIDLFNNEDAISLKAGDTAKIKTGLYVAIPENHVGLVFVRSSMGFKHDITLSNSVGVIDSDYRGEIQVKLFNHGDKGLIINKGDRVAQLVILPLCTEEVEYVEELDETSRGDGGFGSTGKN